MVTQFHMTGWPEHGRPASTGSVLELLDMTTRAQMNSGNRPITVICKSDSIANSTVVYNIFLCVCVCHLYNNLSVHLFYLSLYLSSKLFICSISHSIYLPNCSFVLSLTLSIFPTVHLFYLSLNGHLLNYPSVLSLTLSISQTVPLSSIILSIGSIFSLSLPPLSSDGVGRTGTFICLHSQLERLKTEGVVNVLQAVKSARIQRAGLVRNAVCSFFCLSFSITLLSVSSNDFLPLIQTDTHSHIFSIYIGTVYFLS